MILTIGQICVLSANLAPESYCDFLLDVDRRQFVAVALEQSCEKDLQGWTIKSFMFVPESKE